MLQHNPPHPGGVIERLYLKPNNLSFNEVAAKLQVSSSTFYRLVKGKSGVSPVMALKLSRVLGRSPESWLAMQHNFDLWKIKAEIDFTSYTSIKF